MIDRAVEILRRGGLVAFPTETVYGLGADARNADAVAKIFGAKGRPATNPLIVHVHSVEAAKRYALEWPSIAEKLAQQFWPGPLTLVVQKVVSIVDAVTAGGPTVGLRVPNHPIALELLRAFDGPVAAPSANRSNRISPTTAEHVRQELGKNVDLILDGGPCAVGLESTVLSLVQATPTILRPGGVSQTAIQQCIGRVHSKAETTKSSQPAQSPGQLPVHYSPTTLAIWITSTELVPRFRNPSAAWIVIHHKQYADKNQWFRMPKTAEAYAPLFYATLREADSLGVDHIFIEMPPDTPEWAAVRDRIGRAARPLQARNGSKD